MVLRNADVHNFLINNEGIQNDFPVFMQRLCDVHALSRGVLPDVPGVHHVVLLRRHLQALQEDASLQGIYFPDVFIYYCFYFIHLSILMCNKTRQDSDRHDQMNRLRPKW